MLTAQSIRYGPYILLGMNRRYLEEDLVGLRASRFGHHEELHELVRISTFLFQRRTYTIVAGASIPVEILIRHGNSVSPSTLGVWLGPEDVNTNV